MRRLMTTALIAMVCLTGPLASAQTVKPASTTHVKSPIVKKPATATAKKAVKPAAKKAAATVKKPTVKKAKAPAARPPAKRAVTSEVTLV